MHINIERVEKAKREADEFIRNPLPHSSRPADFWIGYISGLSDVTRGSFMEFTQEPPETLDVNVVNDIRNEVHFLREVVARGIITDPDVALAAVLKKMDDLNE